MNDNLYLALRAGFPEDLDLPAIEVADPPGLSDASADPVSAVTYSWRDLEQSSARMAHLLASLELPPSSRIAVQVDKSVESLLLYLAVLRAGHVYLPLNSAYQAAELDYFIGDAEPAVVVCAPRHFSWISQLAFRHGVRQVFTLGERREGSLLERADFHSAEQTPVLRNPADLAAILYTSGTTGRSKGAMLSHGNLRSNAEVLRDYWGWRDPASAVRKDVLIHALPLFHVHGLFVACHAALISGSKMLWFGKFDPQAVLSRLLDATVFMGVPTLYVRLLAEAGLTPEACQHMRLFISGSAPLLTDTFQDWQRRTGHTILERYGMSETLMLTSNPYRPRDGERRGGTVGRPLPGVSLRIRDAQGRPLKPGDIGGIEVLGPNVFAGYWRMPEKTREEFTDDGWFKTGDVGQVDTDGYVTIVGRSKDLIITGGYNVYPAEVEGYLNALPGVLESAVIGVPHPDFGEAVVAVVVAREGTTLEPAELIGTLKREIANFKVPKRIDLMAALPRNAMGKVQKNLLREERRLLFAGSSPQPR